MTKGYKTTEFWLALAAQVVGILMASGIIADGSNWSRLLGMAAMVLTGMGYSVSRGMVKAGQPATLPAQDKTA